MAMTARRAAAVLALLLLAPAAAMAQQPGPPLPPAVTAQPLPPPAAAAAPAGAPSPPATPAQPAVAGSARVFCDHPVSVKLAARSAVPERYRKFIGIWSDASWTPSACAALIVANVTPDGTASIFYVFGPLEAGPHAPGGILRGTGIIRDGELKFQNSDGSQFAFRPLYDDLDGHLTTPNGQSYEAIFKETP